MPQWDGCMKIHQGCGGLVKWTEALETPGVGYYGKCEACQTSQIVQEQIIPVDESKVDAKLLLKNKESDRLSDLEWVNEATWFENQERLKKEIHDKLKT